jgi:hypothetical protein
MLCFRHFQQFIGLCCKNIVFKIVNDKLLVLKKHIFITAFVIL